MNAAACNDSHVRILAYIKIVIYHILKSGLRKNDGDVHALVFCSGLYDNVDSGYVGLCNDIYMLGRVARIELSVSADIVCAARYLMQIGNLLEQLSLNIIH